MPKVSRLPEQTRADMIGRLQRVEGQARGIQKMINEDRDCVDVMNQIAAVKAAVNSLSAEVFESFALYCVRHPDEFAAPEDAIEQVVKTLVRAGK